MTTIEYRGSQRATKEIEEYFERWRWMVPPWCQKLTVHADPVQEDSRTYADTEIDYNYRYGTITIYPMWFGLDDNYRHNTIIHELIHVLLSPLDGVYERCRLDELKQAMLEESTEQVVCDIAYVVQRMAEQ